MQIAERSAVAGSEADVITRHDRLIRKLARRWGARFVDDLVQVGRLALLEAARSYQADRGAALWTYARRAVLGAMIDYATREINRLESALVDDDSSDDLEAQAAVDLSQHDELVMREMLAALTPDEIRVVKLAVCEGLDFETIGQRLGRSREYPRRIFEGALLTIRERAEVGK